MTKTFSTYGLHMRTRILHLTERLGTLALVKELPTHVQDHGFRPQSYKQTGKFTDLYQV